MGRDFSLAGATISFLGDSITAFDVYQKQVQTLLNAKAINSYGVPGSTISGSATESFINRVSQIATDSELIFIFGGVNDFYFNMPLGRMSDPPSPESFYGSIKLLLQLLKRQCPKAAVVFATPLQCTVEAENGKDGKNAAGNGLNEYVQAILEICHNACVPVVDLFSGSGITADNAAEYLSDGVHPNEKGFTVLAQDIVQGLKRLYAKE